MFDSLPKERRSILKVIFGFGTIASAIYEVIKYLIEPEPSQRLVALMSPLLLMVLFGVSWALDVFKDLASEVASDFDQREDKSFSSFERVSVNVTARPDLTTIRALGEKFYEVLLDRYPRTGNSKLVVINDPKSLFRCEIRRGNFTYCSVIAGFEEFNDPGPSEVALTPSATLYLGSFEIGITRKSTCRSIIIGSLCGLIILFNILKLVDWLAEGEEMAFVILFIVYSLVCVVVWQIDKRSAQLRFPESDFRTLKGDFESLLANTGATANDGTSEDRSLLRSPFAEVHTKNPWPRVVLTVLASLAILIGLFSYLFFKAQTAKTLTVQEAESAILSGNYDYKEVRKVLSQKAANDPHLECLWEKAAYENHGYDDLWELAQLGNASALFEVGDRGLGGGADGAIQKLKQASDLGMAEASASLSDFYQWERNPGHQSESWFYTQRAAKQGLNSSQCTASDHERKLHHFGQAFFWARVCEELPKRALFSRFDDQCDCREKARNSRKFLKPTQIREQEKQIQTFVEEYRAQRRLTAQRIMISETGGCDF